MIDRPGVVASRLAELPEANDQVEGSQDRWRNRDTRNDEQWQVQGGFGVSALVATARVDLTLRGDGAITGTLADYSNGLPSLPGMTVTPRPAGFVPAPFDFRDPTAVHRSVQIRTS